MYVDERLRPAMPEVEADPDPRRGEGGRVPGVRRAGAGYTATLSDGLYDLPTLLQARIGQPGLYVVEVVTESGYWCGAEELYRPGGLKGRSLTSVQGDDKQRHDLDTDRPAPDVIRTIQQAQTAYDGRPLPPVAAEDLEPRRTQKSSVDRPGGSGHVHRDRDRRTARLRADAPARVPPQAAPSAGDPAGRKAIERLHRGDPAAGRLDDQAGRSGRPTPREQAAADAGAARPARRRRSSSRCRTQTSRGRCRTTCSPWPVRWCWPGRPSGERPGRPVQPPCFFDPTHKSGTQQVGW